MMCVHMCMCAYTYVCVVPYPPSVEVWDLAMATTPFCRHEQGPLGLRRRALLPYLRICIASGSASVPLQCQDL